MNEVKMVTPVVKLIGYTQTIDGRGPESVIAAAAKLCYSKIGADEILEKMTSESIQSYILKLRNLGHESPFEHASFNFYVEGISRACSHQIVRHRIASYSQQSQRYVDLSEVFRFVVPEEIKNNEKAIRLYEESILKDLDNYSKIVEALYEDYIKKLENPTKSMLSKCHKKALENARFALPNACETKLFITMNARSLFNFFEHRMCTRAQEEIREVANQMLDLCLDVAPTVFAKSGAPCTFKKCPEGTMSCGKVQSPREKQRRILKEL